MTTETEAVPAAEKKRKRTALDAERAGVMFWVDPDDLVLIDDPKHDLYDERMKLPVLEADVVSVMTFGVRKPIEGRKNGSHPDGRPIVEVTDGRQRVKWAREANARLRARGAEPIKVRVIVEKLTEDDQDVFMVLGNSGRRDDDPITMARKAARIVARVGEQKAAAAFCVDPRTLRARLKLLDLGEDVQERVRSGAISPTAALKLVDLPREEQTTMLAQITSGEVGATTDAVAGAVEKKRGKPGKSAAKERFASARAKLLDVVLAWAAEEAKLEDVKDAGREFAAAAKAAKKAGTKAAKP